MEVEAQTQAEARQQAQARDEVELELLCRSLSALQDNPANAWTCLIARAEQYLCDADIAVCCIAELCLSWIKAAPRCGATGPASAPGSAVGRPARRTPGHTPGHTPAEHADQTAHT